MIMLRHLNIIISKYYDIKIIIPNKETLVLRAGAVGHSLVRTIGRTRRIPVSFRRTARTHRRRRSAGFFPRDIYIGFVSEKIATKISCGLLPLTRGCGLHPSVVVDRALRRPELPLSLPDDSVGWVVIPFASPHSTPHLHGSYAARDALFSCGRKAMTWRTAFLVARWVRGAVVVQPRIHLEQGARRKAASATATRGE
jgi:hypothetical protein